MTFDTRRVASTSQWQPRVGRLVVVVLKNILVGWLGRANSHQDDPQHCY